MTYSIQIRRSAARELARVPGADRARLVEAIDRLAENPFLGETLKGRLQGLRRLRSGAYRVIYELQERALLVLVVRVAHRQGAYR